MFYLYVLRNPQNKIYVGVSKNPKRRLGLHLKGRGAKYTSDYRGFRIAYTECYPSLKEAVTREKQLKNWSKAKKIALMQGNTGRLKELSRSSSKE